jgi:hypothetical protein
LLVPHPPPLTPLPILFGSRFALACFSFQLLSTHAANLGSELLP